jgi:hypothetical protein
MPMTTVSGAGVEPVISTRYPWLRKDNEDGSLYPVNRDSRTSTRARADLRAVVEAPKPKPVGTVDVSVDAEWSFA